ncbi:hypothetical protein [Sinomonas halotolerans]|uniref:Membrane protein YczE n=1 Tax=Sinomonas halotolerans TaxID=1644133 RepID=A0ABU9X4S3_9MICC
MPSPTPRSRGTVRPAAAMTRFLSSQGLASRLLRLYVGLFAYGIAIALIVRAGLGASPWDVLAQGVSRTVGATFGVATIAISAVVLLLWIPLRLRPGWGTLSNAALVGVFADLGLAWIPAADGVAWQIADLAAGLVLLAFATALYIGAQLGPGARDGLMTGLVARTGWPVWAVRSGIEVTVVIAGWLLGGTVGIGTAVFAFGIGPLVQLALRVLGVQPASRMREPGEGTELPVSGAAAR